MRKSACKKEKGFTLVEMLVSITLFSMVIVIVMAAMLTIIDVNRKSQNLASVINNFNSAVESMNRTIKSAEVDTLNTCNNSSSCIELQLSEEKNLVSYNDSDGDGDDSTDFIVRYRLDNGSIEREVDENGFSPITSKNIQIEQLKFQRVKEENQELIIIKIAGVAGTDEDTQTEFRVQTSVSRRTPSSSNVSGS